MIDLSLFENPEENVYVLKKWNWDYLEAESFQLACVDYVAMNPHVSLFIICSHPKCFTLGRGLQKLKDSVEIELIDFDHNITPAFPLYQIKRGGGLTFHYPGQIVLYPIINLTYHKLVVHDFMKKIMEAAQATLRDQFNLQNLLIRNDLLGLWVENKVKIASIGLAVTRFNTYHGMALNFLKDPDMFSALSDLYPCGLPGKTYNEIESLSGRQLTIEDSNNFTNSFMNTLTKNYSSRLN